MLPFFILLLCACFASSTPLLQRQQIPKTPVDPQTYQDLVYYAGFVITTGDLATGSCSQASNGATLVQYFSINSTQTQAAIWRSAKTREFVLGIAPSYQAQDYLTDLSIPLVPYISPNVFCVGCNVHLGFLTAWNSLYQSVADALVELYKDPENWGYTTVISGGSLGAAIAALAFASLKNGPYRVTRTYTYGQPRTGDQLFANYIDSLSGDLDIHTGTLYRVTHQYDPVPQLPPTILGYHHHRSEYWESTFVPAENTTYRCYGQEPSDCINTCDGLDVNPEAHPTYAGTGVYCT